MRVSKKSIQNIEFFTPPIISKFDFSLLQLNTDSLKNIIYFVNVIQSNRSRGQA
jgi:hypothetical protein